MAAETLARSGAAVTVFERMPSVGRKLLLAGRGGLNLTHSEPIDRLVARYGDAATTLIPAIGAFDPDALRTWCAELGQEPFVGSSGRVFPSGFRATPLLRAWLARLAELGVVIRTRHDWRGWSDDGLRFIDADGLEVIHRCDATVLSLGGASWPRSGSNGAWVEVVESAGVAVAPLRPANCGFVSMWPPGFAERFAGTPLKDVTLTIDGSNPVISVRGEAMVTERGLEGGAIYALSKPLRDAIDRDGHVTVLIDLKPHQSVEHLAERLALRPKDSTATALRRAGISPVAIAMLRDSTGNDLRLLRIELAHQIKRVAVLLMATEPIDRAISTAGGIGLDQIDERFMLRTRPGTFVAGEMLDWEAPTGGYLLQATFSTGVAAARGALAWLDDERAGRAGQPGAPPAARPARRPKNVPSPSETPLA